MVNVPDALRYLAKNDLARQDHTTLGHLRTWLTDAIEQHRRWLSDVAGLDQEFEIELRSEIETLSRGLREATDGP